MLSNDFDGRENTIPTYVNKRVLGQLPQPAFTSAKQEPQCPCISTNKDRSFYCVPNYRKISSQPVKACYSYIINGGTWDKQASLQAEQPTDQTNHCHLTSGGTRGGCSGVLQAMESRRSAHVRNAFY
jgi:hypothetical protein